MNSERSGAPDCGDEAETVELGLALARVRVALDEARAELEICRTDLDLRSDEVERLSRLCLQLQSEVEALRSSTSWRVTWPLRQLALLLRR